MELHSVALSSQLILGEYLNHIAFIKDMIPSEIRELARIGADVIAASSQYTLTAIESLEKSEVARPLPVFALVRSSIYGMIYLENIDLVREKKKVPSPGKYIQKSIDTWNNENISDIFGKFDISKDYHSLWSQLSEFVHIIPAIKDNGGAHFGQVKFDYKRDLSIPSRHAGLPEQFEDLAKDCITWLSLLSLSTLIRFRKNHPQLFKFRSDKVQNHLENIVFPDCISSIKNMPVSKEMIPGLRILSNKIFHNS